MPTPTSNQSPSIPPLNSSNGSYFPAPIDSPSKITDAKHREQLLTYKRDPPKAAAANRLATLDNLWGSGRRLITGIEEGHQDHDEKKKRYGPWLHSWYYLRSPRIRRYLFYLLGALTMYYIIVRPLVTTTSTTTSPVGSSSTGANTQSQPTHSSKADVKPLHARTKIDTRAPLPPAVVYRSAPDHPIERGLLKVDPESQVHPIYQLIRDARESWDQKILKQSKNLTEAVAEYKRRYHQNPPLGFDKWWHYVW